MKQTIMLYGEIAFGMAEDLDSRIFRAKSGDTIDVRLHGPGGSVFEGLAIFNTLRRASGRGAKVVVHIDGVAASAHSFVAMAGDEIRMVENGFMFLHAPQGLTAGDADDHRYTAELLDKIGDELVDIYSTRTGRTVAEVRQWLADERWLNATEAQAAGLVDTIAPPQKMAAKADKFSDPTNWQRYDVSQNRKETTMTPTEIKDLAPGCTSDFVLAQIEEGADEVTVLRNWNRELQNQIGKANRSGNKPLGTAPSKRGGGGDAVAEWKDTVLAMEQTGLPRHEAYRRACREYPERRVAFVEAVNDAANRPCELRS